MRAHLSRGGISTHVVPGAIIPVDAEGFVPNCSPTLLPLHSELLAFAWDRRTAHWVRQARTLIEMCTVLDNCGPGKEANMRSRGVGSEGACPTALSSPARLPLLQCRHVASIAMATVSAVASVERTSWAPCTVHRPLGRVASTKNVESCGQANLLVNAPWQCRYLEEEKKKNIEISR